MYCYSTRAWQECEWMKERDVHACAPGPMYKRRIYCAVKGFASNKERLRSSKRRAKKRPNRAKDGAWLAFCCSRGGASLFNVVEQSIESTPRRAACLCHFDQSHTFCPTTLSTSLPTTGNLRTADQGTATIIIASMADSNDSPANARPVPTSSPAPTPNAVSMPAYGVSPPVPNIPPYGGPSNANSPVLTPQRNVDSGNGTGDVRRLGREETPVTTPLADSEIPTPVNPSDLDSLPISDEQKARIIQRQ